MIYLQSNAPILKTQFQGIWYTTHIDVNIVSQDTDHPLTPKTTVLCSVTPWGTGRDVLNEHNFESTHLPYTAFRLLNLHTQSGTTFLGYDYHRLGPNESLLPQSFQSRLAFEA